MWDMITSMATDRLWIYTGIAGSLFGAAFLFYIKDTRAGLWCYSKFDKSIDFLEIDTDGLGLIKIRMHGKKFILELQ